MDVERTYKAGEMTGKVEKRVKKSRKTQAETKVSGKTVPNRAKAGTSKAATAARRARFCEGYIQNGGNATQAAVAAGYSARSARRMGTFLTTDPHISAWIKRRREIAERAAEAVTGLTVERTLREIARIAYSDQRKLFHADGTLIPVHELDDNTAATVAGIEHDDIATGRGKKRKTVGVTTKLKIWDKNSALEKAMRYHGLYGKDNEQKGDAAIAALIAAVGINAGKFTVKS